MFQYKNNFLKSGSTDYNITSPTLHLFYIHLLHTSSVRFLALHRLACLRNNVKEEDIIPILNVFLITLSLRK
ncbi:hypothetical protein Pcinc_018877 [Petrolisthes cinctipes]|uniref:Uncharacterized protein n=1 Tax=Petrolisthes cinctipes TaxID=88211 RepID=A0AAE1KLX4_PETCI|nr:hypothetical protein Pcinc_018877 [Petrolisthes cinctipes]